MLEKEISEWIYTASGTGAIRRMLSCCSGITTWKASYPPLKNVKN
jgi:hypothetical protein